MCSIGEYVLHIAEYVLHIGESSSIGEYAFHEESVCSMYSSRFSDTNGHPKHFT